MPTDAAKRAEIARSIDAVELELRRMGAWQDEPPPPEQMAFKEAFGMDKLTLEQWLQFILVPRVREKLAGDGEFPQGSMISVHATREFDGNDGAHELLERLREFDALFNAPAEPERASTLDDGTDVSEAFHAVRGFIIGIQVGMAHASRAHLTRPMRDDATYTPSVEFEINDFHTADPEAHGDCAVVRTKILGKSASGEPAEQEMPFVILREDGEWRIDLDRTLAMAATGDPHSSMDAVMEKAMESMAATMGGAVDAAGSAIADAFSAEAAAEYTAALADFEENTRPRAEEEIGQALNVPVKIEVDWDGCEKRASPVQSLAHFLANDFPTGLRAMTDDFKPGLAEGLKRIVIGFSDKQAGRGFRKDGDALLVSLDPEFSNTPSWIILSKIFELAGNPNVSQQFGAAWANAGALQDALKEKHGINALVEPDWQRFTGSFEEGVDAWALYLLSEKAIGPFAEGLEAALSADTARRDALRDRLREIRIQPAMDAGGRELSSYEGTLQYTLFVAETHEDYWTADELRDRLSDVLTAMVG